MDSREPTPSQPPNMMAGPPSYTATTTTTTNINSSHNSSMMINPNSGGGGPTMIPQPPGAVRFPFNSSKPLDSLNNNTTATNNNTNNAGPYDGSPGFSIEGSAAKKKRGRPRKYSPDGNIALGLTPTPGSASSAANHGETAGALVVAGNTSLSEPPLKKHRGRPPGSGKKQLDALGAGGVGFTPHVIMVKAGEDIASKIMAFSQQGPRTVCILSANGAICNVTLRQPAMSGGTVTYEGRFEIISLSGSFLLSENNGNRSRTGGLSVSLAGSDGRVLGGGVAGMLMAASPVQVIVGSFIADGKKPTSNNPKSGVSSAPTLAPAPQMLNFGAPLTAASPPSQGASSDSSDDDGGSPINRGPGFYTNASQPLHGMQMYVWAGQTQQ